MYQNFFGLSKAPFEARADAQFYFATPAHKEALAALQYDVGSKGGSALVVGEAGVGKTQLVRQLILGMQPVDRVVIITWPPNGQIDVLREVCKGFGLSIPLSYSEARGLARLRRQLVNIENTKGHAVVVLDQAENLCPDAMMQVAMMAGLGQQPKVQLRLVLAGQSRTLAMLNRPEFGQLQQQLFPPRELPALTIEETRAYLKHRLGVAGATETEVFGADAIEVIHSISSGIPRLINRVADAAMAAAYGAQRKRIDRDLVLELDFPTSSWSSSHSVTPSAGRKSVRGASADRANMLRGAMDTSAKNTVEAESEAGWRGLPESSTSRESYRMDAEVGLDRLGRALARAERMQASLEASTAQRLAVEKHLTSLTEGADALGAGLAQAVERASQGMERIEQRVERLLVGAHRRIQLDQAQVQQSIEASSDAAEQVARAERVCERAEELEGRLAGYAEQLADKADDVQSHVANLVGGVAAGEKIQGALATQAAQQRQAFESQTAQVQQLLATAQAAAEEANRLRCDGLGDVEARFKEFEAQADRIASKLTKQIKQGTEQVKAVVDQAQGEMSQSQDRAEQLRDTTQTLLSTLDDRRKAFEGAAELARKRMGELNQGLEQARLLEGKVSDGLVSLGSLAQRIDDARKAAEGAFSGSTSKFAQMQHDVGKFEQQVRELERRATDATENLSKLQADSTDSIEQVSIRMQERLNESRALEESLAATLAGGETTVRTLQEQADHLVQDVTTALQRAEPAREIVIRGDETLAALTSLMVSCEDQENQFIKQLQKAAEVEGSAASILSKADQQLANLDAQQAMAGQVLEKLSAANADGERIVAQAVENVSAVSAQAAEIQATMENAVVRAKNAVARTESAAAGATKSQTEIERLVQDVWSLTTKTETLSQTLGEQNAEAKRQAKRLASAIAPATKLAAAIDEKVGKAKTDVEAIAGPALKAEELLQRLQAAGEGIEDAKNVVETIGQTLVQAEDIKGALELGIRTADQRAALLGKVGEDVTDLLDRHEQVHEASELTLQQLTDAIGSSQGSAEVAERLMAEFLKQSADIGSKLTAMTKQADEVERRLTEQMDKPSELIATARTQAAQLERVCAAVRKVFAGLSKASLDAQQQMKGVEAVGQTTAERLEKLIADSDAAGQIVKEWVEEAVRVQTRLQGAIEAAPSIHETHSGEELARISKRVDQVGVVGRDRTSAAPNGRDRSAQAPKSRLDARIANPSSRAEQVAQLIEDARLGTVEAGLGS